MTTIRNTDGAIRCYGIIPVVQEGGKAKYLRDDYTTNHIFHLDPNQIFVFGSNLAGAHCGITKVEWLEDATSFGGHSRPKGGHRRVSGIVRARLKEEARREGI